MSGTDPNGLNREMASTHVGGDRIVAVFGASLGESRLSLENGSSVNQNGCRWWL